MEPRLSVRVRDLVAELHEPSLLNVGIEGGREDGVDRTRNRVELVGEVEPFQSAVGQVVTRFPGSIERVEDRLAVGSCRLDAVLGAERLLGVAVVREPPVDAVRGRDDLAQHALGHAEFRAHCPGGRHAFRVDEVVHVRRKPEVIREVVVHRVRRVQDDQDVDVSAGAGLEELPVVRAPLRRHQEQGDEGRRDPMSRGQADQPGGSSMVSHVSPQNGNRAGRGPISTSATRAFEYWRSASSWAPRERSSYAYMNWAREPCSLMMPPR